ncbi:hypothetical protein [Kutzneria albida]|uniref:Uncharacterized protein n=1 Tax=Kutzneria albida DSM 43870 TaxID=1449976 RepID=W5WBJ6_9PSEU|nr:hypothetical protein [Kutzneria albida]AHH98232.1 hypothetical protein KALB_4870 [Kutzneria albida DSM 43870]
MARSYARLMTSIWRNREFRGLDSAAQRMYLLLVTQPDISAAGTLPLTVRRWADLAADTDIQGVTSALTTLAAKRFIAFDRNTEELLVRSFVKWDGGHRNSKRRPVIFRAAEELVSPALRRVLADEFSRLDLPVNFLTDSPSDTASDGLSRAASDPTSVQIDEQMPSSAFPQVDRLSDALSDSPADAPSQFEGVVLRTTQKKEQKTPPTVGREAPGTQQIVGAWIDTCRKRPPGNVIGQISKNVKAMLEEGIDHSDVQAGLLEWARKALHPSTLPSVVNEVMNRPASPARPVGPVGSGSKRMDKALAALAPDDPFRAQYAAAQAAAAEQTASSAETWLVIEGGKTA